MPLVMRALLLAAFALSVLLSAAAARACSLAAGSHDRTLLHDGLMRGYRIEVPPGCDPASPLPVVFDFHGSGVSPVSQGIRSGMPALGASEGFVTVNPEGVGLQWNAFNGLAGTSTEDDVGFVRALVAEIVGFLPIDGQRIYATGHSNGGAFTHRLACEAADLLAAAVPVSYSLHGDFIACLSGRAFPLLQVHGLGDTIVPYAGVPASTIGPILSAPDSATAWASKAGCTGTPVTEVLAGSSSCDRWLSCEASVEVGLCSIAGGHFIQDANSDDVEIGPLTWAFLSVHTLPEPAGLGATTTAVLAVLGLARGRTRSRRGEANALPSK